MQFKSISNLSKLNKNKNNSKKTSRINHSQIFRSNQQVDKWWL